MEPEDIAQDEDRELARRQELQRRHERQRDGLDRLVPGLGADRHVDRGFEQRIGTRLQPDDFAEPGWFRRFDPGHVPLLGRAPAGRAARVEAPVGGDPVEPGAERGASLESSEPTPRGQQRVLDGVLGVLEGSEHPVAVHLELAAVRFGQLPERVLRRRPSPSRSGRPSRRPLSRRRGVCIVNERRREEPAMLLKDKVAVIYGAGGAIGGAVARTFASEGARLFVTGRDLAPVEVVTKDVVRQRRIRRGGGGGRSRRARCERSSAVGHRRRRAASTSRSTRSGSPTRRSSACRWSSWMSSDSPGRSRHTRGRTS